jgi:microcystin-dependent protein
MKRGRRMKRGLLILFLTASCIFGFSVIPGSCQDAITVLPSGNVGIGTSNPIEKLEVNGTIKSNDRIKDKTGPITPVGSIVMWPSENPPDGWLECNGDPISRETYADLYSVIGDMYGPGDEITTFNLPDMRGMFVRGWNHDKEVVPGEYEDPDASNRTDRGDNTEGDNIGTRQSYQIQKHGHTLRLAFSGSGNYHDTDKNNSSYNFLDSSSSVEPYGGGETRPENIYLMFIIKY